MAKLDRASLLLAWGVTVIISQCSAEPVQCVPDITCTACEKLAEQLYYQFEDKRAEIFSEKIIETATKRINEIAENVCIQKQELVEQDSKGQCGSECKTCRQVSRCFNNDNQVADYLYLRKPDLFSFTKFICKEFTGVCRKPQPVLKWLKKGVDAGKNKLKDAGQKLNSGFKGIIKQTKQWFPKFNKNEHEHEL